MATDFEKYPKYHLDTHGRIVQQILDNAETVFGMAPEGEEVPTIQSTVGGGQHIVNKNNRRAIFGDDFTLDNMGGIVIRSAGNDDIKAAVANYATEDDILDIFASSTSADLTPANTPKIRITGSQISISLDGSGNVYQNIENLTDTKLYYQVTNISSSNSTSTAVKMASELMSFAPSSCGVTKVGIIIPGDLVTTADSEPVYIYFIHPGLPEYTSSAANQYTFPNTEPSILKGTNCFNSSIKYKITTYNYGNGELNDEDVVELSADSLDRTLIEGQSIEVYYDVTFKEVAEPTYDKAMTIICQPKLQLANYRKLTRPAIDVSDSLKFLTFAHGALEQDLEVAPVNKSYIYSIQRTTESTWSADCYITTNDKIPSFIINTPVIIPNNFTGGPLVAGDLIRVKSVTTNYYYDSDYTYFVVPPATTPGPGIYDGLVIDNAASGIVSAELYTITDSDWGI